MSTAEIDVVQQMEQIKHNLSFEESVVKVVDVTPGSVDESDFVKVNGDHDGVITASENIANGLPEARKPEETVQISDPIESKVIVIDEVVDIEKPGELSEPNVNENSETEGENVVTVQVIEECGPVQGDNLVEDIHIELNLLQITKEVMENVTLGASESVFEDTLDIPAVESVVMETPPQEDIVQNGENIKIGDPSSDELKPPEAEDEPAVGGVVTETPSQAIEEHVVENGEDVRIAEPSMSESIPRELVEGEVLVVEPSKYGNFKPKIKIAMPKLKLLNGETMPVFGLGTWQAPSEEVGRAVRAAIDCGYRHIDCAYVYKNEQAVGDAIAAKVAEGVVKREELFICTKLWNTDHEPKDVEKACRRSLELLGLDYLDLYLMHTPMGFKSGEQLLPKIAGVIQYSPVDYLDTWYEMEKLVSAGLTKSIGVSNFNISQLERLWGKAKIKPVTNQVECHPFLNQQKMSSWCSVHGVVLTAYSPLGSGAPASNAETSEVLIDNQLVRDMARKYARTPAQILIRYQLERGHATIPKSVSPARLQENIGALDFTLKPEDVYSLNQLNKNKRYVPFVGFGDTHKDYPFNSPN